MRRPSASRRRAARLFPPIFEALEDGRLHLTGLRLIAAQLTLENAAELLAAAVNQSKAAIEQMLAARFPREDVPTLLRPIAASPQHAPGHVLVNPQNFSSESEAGASVVDESTQALATASAAESASGPVETPSGHEHVAHASYPRIAPLAPERFALQVTIDQGTHDKLRRAQELLSHTLPSGDLAQVLARALDALITQLEKRKFAKSDRPKARAGSAHSHRHVPAHVKRQVWERDKGQCTFMSSSGHRCSARKFLEFDHIEPVARGGLATIAGLRLRCRAHNQHEAEQVFGAGFMHEKRGAARRAGSGAA